VAEPGRPNGGTGQSKVTLVAPSKQGRTPSLARKPGSRGRYPRRVGAETSKTRGLLLDNTERLMLDEGYAAVTYRRVATSSGVTAGLVQYYFPTLDDLFIALLERRSARNIERFSQLLERHSEGPLRAIWEYSRDETTAALMTEIMALGNHRKAIRAEIAAVSERARKAQLEALSKMSFRLEGAVVPPTALLFLLQGIPKLMLMESELGVTIGHIETLALVEHCINLLEPLKPTLSPDRKAQRRVKAGARRASSS